MASAPSVLIDDDMKAITTAQRVAEIHGRIFEAREILRDLEFGSFQTLSQFYQELHRRIELYDREVQRVSKEAE